jgi:L-malate glycosyltransferase
MRREKTRLNIGITCYPTHGGSGVIATELGKWMAEKGHEVHFITHDMPFRLGRFDRNIFYHGVEANQYAVFKYPPYDLALASRMAQVAKVHRLDLLHVHYAVPHAICAYLAKQMVGPGLKVVTTLHGTDITVLGEDSSLRDIICFGIRESDAVTAVSKDLVKQTRELWVYYPREVSGWRREIARPGEKILLHISNFRPVKRATDVIRIFHRVREQVPARLLMIGEGPEWSRAVQLVQELNIEPYVEFLGKKDEVAQWISLADLLLLPSEKESFGLVALEAMACGVPTVGSDTGGLPEVVVHGQTGYLAGVGDVETMARYAVRLLTDPDLHRKFSESGIARVRKYFCVDRVAEQYEAIYRRVLGEG